eukprot:1241347-Prymnesium_polylepis.1
MLACLQESIACCLLPAQQPHALVAPEVDVGVGLGCLARNDLSCRSCSRPAAARCRERRPISTAASLQRFRVPRRREGCKAQCFSRAARSL